MVLEKKTFNVSGIHCEGCEQRIARSLSQMSGVRSVTASHAIQEVAVTLDSPSMSVREIAAKLDSIGFPATSQLENR